MPGEKLVNLMNKGKPNPTELADVVYGEVTSIEPLKVKIDNRYEVAENFLLLSRSVKEMIINVPNDESISHTHSVGAVQTSSGGDPSHTHTVPAHTTQSSLPQITLWRGLLVGDKVIMLRVSKGQLFYVMERVEVE